MTSEPVPRPVRNSRPAPDDEPPAQAFDRYLAEVERDLAQPRKAPRPGPSERLLWIAMLGSAIAAYGGAAWAIGRWLGWW